MSRSFIIAIALATGCGGASPAPIATPAQPQSQAHEIRGAQHVTFSSRDADLTHGAPTLIDGWVFRPPGTGSRPAIVALHGCAGLFASNGDLAPRDRDWAERLAAQGYVVLLPDSFGPRGQREICSQSQRLIRPAYERARDAYGALEFLDAQPDVDPARVAIFGWSNGAITTLAAIAAHSRARPHDLAHDFRVAIAFYPDCRSSLARSDWAPPLAPLHVLIGANDDWTPAAPCGELVDRVRALGASADIVVYPDAFHDFDDPVMRVHTKHDVATTASHTATIGANPAARADAIDRVTRILRDALAP
jgi:dienelactone hydrolase